MADADVNGSDGHGIFRLPQYVKRIRSGGINVTPDIKLICETPATALVDGDNAMGHLVMSHAASVAIEKARTAGVAWVGARNSNHAGPAALYAKMPLAHDMIGLYMAVGNANHLPPWGGIDMLLSTNPIAVAVPANRHPPIVLDMATTVAAYGKVKTAAQRGETMPEGWMIDRQGNPLTDPTRADEGFLLPIGGAKGYGLALIFGLLAGTLNGAAFGKDVIDFNADSVTPTNTGQLIVAISIAAFADVPAFKCQVDAVIDQMHGSARLPGVNAIRLPGERSRAIHKEREAQGVPVHAGLESALQTLGSELGVAWPG
jgi:LDH2 family malate/lactate/ureidoglycolate dehydrogenase